MYVTHNKYTMDMNINISDAKTKYNILKEEIKQIDEELTKLQKEYKAIQVNIRTCESKKRELSKETDKLKSVIESEGIFDSVLHIEGFETLLQHELIAIKECMNQTDYRKITKNEYPRWIDLEKIVTEVINFKNQYVGWTLYCMQIAGHYDTLPPVNFYKYTYKTPQGHYMSYGGIEHDK